MQSPSRWRAFSIAVVAASVAVFLFFVYAGSVATVQCTSASGACSLRAALGGLDAFSDYLYAVVAVLLGQVVLLSAWYLRKSR